MDFATRRNVSFNLKPDVQIFKNISPHISPLFQPISSPIATPEKMPPFSLELLPPLKILETEEHKSETPHLSIFVPKIQIPTISIRTSPKDTKSPVSPLSPHSINEIKDMRHQEQQIVHQAIREANELESYASVFINRHQGLPIIVQFSTLREAWQFGISYLYNHTEGAFTLFPLKDRILLKRIAHSWANNEKQTQSHYAENVFSAYPTSYNLGGSSLFTVTIYKGHDLPKKNPYYYNSGIIMTGPITAMQHGPYSQIIELCPNNTQQYNKTTEWLIYTVLDTPIQGENWEPYVEQTIQSILLEMNVM